LEGSSLKLTDSWQFPEAHPLTVTFLSYSPWEIAADGQKAVSGRMTLTVHSQEPAHFELEEGMVDFQGQNVYILRVITEAAVKQQVESFLTWTGRSLSENQSGWENKIALQELLDRQGT